MINKPKKQDLQNTSVKPNNAEIKRIIKATSYSLRGLKFALKHEAAIRQEAILLLISIATIYILELSMLERIAMLSSVVLIIIVELINSAIEAVVDRIGTEHHKLSGQAKDIGSAAVLITLLLAAFIWIYILLFNNTI